MLTGFLKWPPAAHVFPDGAGDARPPAWTAPLLACLLAAAMPAFAAGPGISEPQVQQCNDTFVSGSSTRKASPQIKVPIQDPTGLRVGITSTPYRSAAGFGMWRFNTSYTKALENNCLEQGNKRIRSWVYRYDDPETAEPVIVGRCAYSASTPTAGCAADLNTMVLDATVTQFPIRTPYPWVSCPSSTQTIANHPATYSFNPTTRTVDSGCLPEATCGSAKNCRYWTWTYEDAFSNITAGRCTYSASSTTPECGAGIGSMSLSATLPWPIIQPELFSIGACPASTATLPSGNQPTTIPLGRFDTGLFRDSVHAPVVESTQALTIGIYYTMSAWVRTSAGGLQRIFSHQDGTKYWGFGLNGGALRRFDSREDAGNQDNSLGSGLNDNQWHHVAVVRRDGVEWEFYKDGQSLGTTPARTAAAFSTGFSNPAYVGSYLGSSEFFNGMIDDVRLWRYSMTDDEMALDYNATVHRFSINGGSSFSYVFRDPPSNAYNPPASNGTTVTVYYQPAVQSDITTDHKYVFMAQDRTGEYTVQAPYTVYVDKTPPSKPVLSGAPQSTNEILWTWPTPASFCGPPEYAAFYTLINPGSGATIMSVLDPTLQILENFGGEPPNQLHGRVISATDIYGTSPLSDCTTAYTKAAQPTALAATSISTGSFVLQWNNQNNPNYTRYELQYSTVDGFASGAVTLAAISDDFNGSQKGVSGLQNGTTYYARVRAKNGRQTDSYGTDLTAYATADFTTLPAAPVLTGAALSTGSVRWDWTSVTGAFGYKLYSSTNGLMVDTPALSYSSSTLSTNTAYGASVEAYDRYGTAGPRSPTVYIFTLATSPVNASITAVSTNEITVSWDANGNGPQTYYEVVIATNSAFAAALSTQGVTGTSATIKDLFPKTTYYFRVRAVSGGGVATPFIPETPLKAVTYPNPYVSVSDPLTSPYVLKDGLVGLWHMDESSNTSAADSSYTNNVGTLTCMGPGCTSTPTFTTGPPGLGPAFAFPGVSSSMVIMADRGEYHFSGDLSVSAWVKPSKTSQANGTAIAAKGLFNSEDFCLDLTSDTYRFMFKATWTVLSTMTARLGTWDHVMGVYSDMGGTLKIYVNGIQSGPATAAAGRAWSAEPLSVGSRRNASGIYALSFSGAIDEVRVFARALGDAEVLAEYEASKPFVYSGATTADRVSVELPPNAFTSGAAVLFISPDPVSQPVRPGVNFISAGLTVMPTAQRFIDGTLVEIVPVIDGTPFSGTLGSAATVYISYTDKDNDGVLDGSNPPIHASTLRTFVFEPSVMRWDELPSSIDYANRRVAALTRHFSVFALFGAQVYGNSLREVRVYPVPWQIGSGGRFDAEVLVFDRLPTDGLIRIYNLAAEKIVELGFGPSDQGRVVWNGNNYVGQPVASGVYLAYVKSSTDGAQRILKFVVER
ncbi:MAG: fibronectin type III domain-containing protein [Elusimicrobia bacterium]|nr:fibronectin type III domain-containing protein [Elusimicrobiota bacterium]